ncbi:hypothetical protein AKJ09_07698 [Labilithrix luteola]|uniref:Uncharacterized protein n=1 Tax=Labilithrix luteola TaxID=1391654 RepID=A0A0K1Q6J4_9BACT|nr:hypothetical protein AKJ09_07698 [Labilithrix luteola]
MPFEAARRPPARGSLRQCLPNMLRGVSRESIRDNVDRARGSVHVRPAWLAVSVRRTTEGRGARP